MLAGHFAMGFAAKRYAPGVSLFALMMAAQGLDILITFFIITGFESMKIMEGATRIALSLDLKMPISHSLLGATAWGLGAGALYLALRRNWYHSFIIFFLVSSHWFLDLVVHSGDLPLTPGSETMYGLGLWHSTVISTILELGMLAAGVFLYVRTTRARTGTGTGLLVVLVGFIVFSQLTDLNGKMASQGIMVLSAVMLWVYLGLAFLTDKNRSVVS